MNYKPEDVQNISRKIDDLKSEYLYFRNSKQQYAEIFMNGARKRLVESIGEEETQKWIDAVAVCGCHHSNDAKVYCTHKTEKADAESSAKE